MRSTYSSFHPNGLKARRIHHCNFLALCFVTASLLQQPSCRNAPQSQSNEPEPPVPKWENTREAQSGAQKSGAEAMAVLQLGLGAQRRLLFSNSYFLIPALDHKTLNTCRTEVTDCKAPHFNTPELL